MAKKILLVDDERRVRTVVREMLSRRGFEVALAASGEEALAAVAREPFDLLMLDLMLPGIDGASVAQRLRESPETADLPVIFFTGLLETDVSRRRGSRFGGHFFLAKPFDADQLYEVIDRALPGGSPPAGGR